MRRTTILVLTLLMAAIGQAEEPLLKLAPSPLELPARIGPLIGNPEKHVYGQPGMGVSYQYSAPGASLTIYVYDAGIADLADGADTVTACNEHEFAKQSVEHAHGKARLLSQFLVKLLPPEEAPLMREAVYEFDIDGRPAISYVWLTTVARQFIKLRFTADKQLQDELPDARRAILGALGTAIKPHLAPADTAPADKKPTQINVSMDMFEGDAGATGFMYTLMLSAAADDIPEAIPVCGGHLVPPFETELSLIRGLFVLDEEAGDTRLGKQLQQAEASGFLDELVWVEFHRDAWGVTPPEGLTVRDYLKWKKKNLKRFKRPVLGAVSIDHPRPMAVEPLQ